jgi:hypothetical protein
VLFIKYQEGDVMVQAISGAANASVTSAQAITPSEAPKKQDPRLSQAPSKTAASPGTTVSISPAASAAAAAQQEALETPAQTAQEARGNDAQARRLEAKYEAADKLKNA